MNVNRHPLEWIRGLIGYEVQSNHISNNVRLILSKYKYLPQSYQDQRQEFSLPFYELNEFSLFKIISNLSEGEELAFHSQLVDLGSEYHVPLIDFGVSDRGFINSAPLLEFSQHWNMAFQIFNSGRSYHAYGNRLINAKEWIRFMGSLLLLNKPSGFKLIDERWVGHRIMAGYSALRWSNNSSHYKRMPVYVGYLNSVGLFFDPSISNSSPHIIY